MKCISIRQPWAWLIVNGYKNIENRTWQTRHRGVILIHASKTFDVPGWQSVWSNYADINLPYGDDFTQGAIVGAVVLDDIVSEHSSPWFTGPYGWVLRHPTVAPAPMPYKGQLGLFNIAAKGIAWDWVAQGLLTK